LQSSRFIFYVGIIDSEDTMLDGKPMLHTGTGTWYSPCEKGQRVIGQVGYGGVLFFVIFLNLSFSKNDSQRTTVSATNQNLT
jgi:hypothetical protein